MYTAPERCLWGLIHCSYSLSSVYEILYAVQHPDNVYGVLYTVQTWVIL
jgi:hypothetical protein